MSLSPQEQSYHTLIEQMWARGALTADDVSLLAQMQGSLGLSRDLAARIEHAVMGQSREQALLASRRGVSTPAPTFSGARTQAPSPVTAPAALRPGDLVAGRFEVLALLGEGGMGQVWQVRDTRLQELRALKLIRPTLAADDAVLRRFLNEVRLCQRLEHPNIARVYDYGEDAARGLHFYTMEYIAGMSLRAWLGARPSAGGPVALADFQAIADGLCSALRAAHAVTIHRDLKPENVLVSTDLRVIKLTDFGIAKLFDSSAFGMTQGGLGTAHYAAPEQTGGGTVDQRADIYSLAVLFYEVLTGRVARAGAAPVSTLRGDVSAYVDAVIFRAMSVVPDERFATVADFHDALTGAIASARTPAAAPSPRAASSAGASRPGTTPDAPSAPRPAPNAPPAAQSAPPAAQSAPPPTPEFSEEQARRMLAEDIAAAEIAQMHGDAGDFVETTAPQHGAAWRMLADRGDARAMFLLGVMHDLGVGVPADPQRAFTLWKQSAQWGYRESAYMLALCYERGAGAAKDTQLAAQWFRKAADAGHAASQNYLGTLCEEGKYVPRDIAAAITLYEKAVAQGHRAAHGNLGACYREGHGVPRDLDRAIDLFRRGAAIGSPLCMHLLGVSYRDGTGVPADSAEAARWFAEAKAAGYVDESTSSAATTSAPTVLGSAIIAVALWAGAAWFLDKSFATMFGKAESLTLLAVLAAIIHAVRKGGAKRA